jgi:hypothetical protein
MTDENNEPVEKDAEVSEGEEKEQPTLPPEEA